MPGEPVRFTALPSGRTISADSHQTFAEALASSGQAIPADCGGMGTCGQCRIRFLSKPPDPSHVGRRQIAPTDLAAGWRLACQQPVVAGATVEAPSSGGRPQTEATGRQPSMPQRLRPGVEAFRVMLRPTDTWNPTSIDRALCRDMEESVTCSLRALRGLCDHHRKKETELSGVRRGSRILELRAGSEARRMLGLAIDVGTTTLAVQLHDLASGELLASEADYNPQRGLGADVISRIGYVRRQGAGGLDELHGLVSEALNALARAACNRCGAETTDIYKIVAVGNPAMLHLLAGVSPVGIDQSPFEAVFLNSVTSNPEVLGLHAHPEARLELLPSASSYIGADVVAGAMAISLGNGRRTELLVDIGTNGEIVLASGGSLIACSAAAGPAFEGAAIRDGMSATAGAIEDVTLAQDALLLSTIDAAPARGLCGTGLIGAVHQLLRAELIDASGRLRSVPAWGHRLRGEGKDLRFVLAEDPVSVSLYQEDIRAFQLGKAAIRAGIDTLLRSAGVSASELDSVYVAGAFGTHLKAEYALGTGLLPAIPSQRIRAVGNTAGQGAAMVLLDEDLRAPVDALARQIANVELAAVPEFAERYLQQMAFSRNS